MKELFPNIDPEKNVKEFEYYAEDDPDGDGIPSPPPLDGRIALFLEPACKVKVRVTDRRARRIMDAAFRELGHGSRALDHGFEDGSYVVEGLRPGTSALAVESERYGSLVLEVRADRDVVHAYWAVFE